MSGASQSISQAERALVLSNFNASVLTVFLMGVYTSLYIGTMCIYLQRKTSKSYIVISAITALYICYVLGFSGTIAYLEGQVEIINQSLQVSALYSAGRTQPVWIMTLQDIIYSISAVLADSLLVWRCYHVWNRSRRAILVSCTLLFVEAGFFMASNLMECIAASEIHNSTTFLAWGELSDGTAGLTSFSATLLTTGLISYRIFSVSKQDGVRLKRRSLKNAMEIVVHSAAFYAVAAFFDALSQLCLLLPNPALPYQWMVFVYYSASVVTFAQPVAPTLIVARLAMTSSRQDDQDPTTVHIYGLALDTNADASERGNSRAVYTQTV